MLPNSPVRPASMPGTGNTHHLARILFVSHTGIWGGGAEHCLRQIMAVTHGEGHHVALLCPPGSLTDRLGGVTRELYLAPLPELQRSGDPRGTLVLLGRWAASLRPAIRAVRASNASVIYANSGIAALSMWPVASLLRCPLVWHQHDIIPPRSINRWMLGALGRGCAAVAATSEAVAASLGSLGVPRDRIQVIYPRLDPPLVAPSGWKAGARSALHVPEHAHVLSVIGRLVPRKRQDVFLQALALLARRDYDVFGFIVGSAGRGEMSGSQNDGYVRRLHALASVPELQGRVCFLGHVERVAEVYAATDVLVMPSTNEPFGRVVIEACASGVPVVATQAGGPCEVLRDGVSGTLVPPGDVHRFADAIAALLDDPAHAESMAARARADVDERFSERGLGNDIARVLSRSVSDGYRPRQEKVV